MRTVVSRCCF